MRNDEPDAAQMDDSARRVAARLGIDAVNALTAESIESCADVQQLLAAYRAGTLPAARSLLIEAHLHDCGACRLSYKSGVNTKELDWSPPNAIRPILWRPRIFAWGLASAFALLICVLFVYQAFWRIPPGVRAEVRSIDGSAYILSAAGDRRLAPGDVLKDGELFRTSGGAHALLRLSDGSSLEVNERSVLAVRARGRSTTIALDNGAVIVQAVKRTAGYLYVKTPDCRVAVTGTVFSVNAGIKGSRVAVMQGSVHVVHAGIDTVLQAGNQVETSGNLGPEPVDQQIAWSHDRDKYLPLLAQFSGLQRRIEQIPFPQPRYSSDLLERVPTDTLLYVSIPNLGEFMSQANQIFHDQLKQSPELQEWWNSKSQNNTAEVDALVDRLHQMSQYLGDEVVLIGFKQGHEASFAVVADVKRDGLGSFVAAQFPSLNAKAGMTLLDEGSLKNATVSPKRQTGGYALLRAHEIVVSNSLETLKRMNAQLNAGASGFATGEFGTQINAAYARGAGVILAADLQSMMNQEAANHNRSAAIESSGIGGLRYLIAEHREQNGQPENHLNLQFAGVRQRVASWLAAPAPMGSLSFVTPNTAFAAVALSKDPKAIADDILAMTEETKGSEDQSLSEFQQKTQIDLRADLAANLGGEFLVSLDGPVLPTPSWKVVIEVNDAQRIEQTLERLMTFVRNESQKNGTHSIAIESAQVDGRSFYSIHDLTTGATPVQYTFADGYMILAPNRALLMAALQTHTSGDSLAHADAFKALLPKDENENYSAIAYQNLSPVLAPLLEHLSGEAAQAVQSLAADSRPTAICAWGKDSRIEVASNSRLFGFDLLTFNALMKSGNKQAHVVVKE